MENLIINKQYKSGGVRFSIQPDSGGFSQKIQQRWLIKINEVAKAEVEIRTLLNVPTRLADFLYVTISHRPAESELPGDEDSYMIEIAEEI